MEDFTQFVWYADRLPCEY